MNEGQPWRRRQEFPDAQVQGAADQFEAARRLLAKQPPGSGLLLPLMNSAAVAIELYLKCLAAELVHTPDGQISGLSAVTAKPLLKGHILVSLFDRIAESDRSNLEQSFSTECPQAGGLFREMLAKCEGAFAASRYPFEADTDVSRYPLNILLECSAFLGHYVGSLASEHRIEWN